MPSSWKEKVVLDNVDPAVLPFWEGLTREEFLLYRCKACGEHYWPAAYCRKHEELLPLDEMEWVPTSGRGTIFSRLITHQVTDQAWAAETPYCTALVELEEGPLFATRIVGIDPHDVHEEMAVEVEYDHVAETGVTLPLFRPSS